MKHLRIVVLTMGIILALAFAGAQTQNRVVAASPAASNVASASHVLASPAGVDPSTKFILSEAEGLRASLDGQCAINAVDLIAAWVNGGAPNGEFTFKSKEDLDCKGTFEKDIQPLFTTEGIWFEGSQACTECHFDNTGDSRHEMNLDSYEGIMLGGDVLSEPPGVQIVVPGDWKASKLRGRLRNNRMPPGWEFDIEEGNRNGPTLTVDGGEIAAVDLIAAWVDGGAPETEAFKFTDAAGAEHQATFEADVLPLFTEADIWFPGSQACTECHFDNSGDSRHEMDLGTYAGIMLGGDVLSEPPGVQIVVPGDWKASKLRGRLRDNRMPPGWFFDIEEGNRNGPVVHAGTYAQPVCRINAVDLIAAWADAGAPNGDFAFTSLDETSCAATFETDVLPLFTEADIWFPGSQACTECHFDNTGDSRHEMNLGSYEGIMLGGDVLSEPPGVQIVVPGDWGNSKLRARLRNNRMPPGWEFDIEEGNRNGPTLTVDGGEITAVELVGAWVDDGAPETEAFKFTDAAGAEHQATFEADVLPLFTEADIWFPGSQACTECHFDNSGDSRHEMNLGSYEGIMLGGDVLSEPPGVQIVVPGDWKASKLRGRLRDNRMPPGWFFDIEEGNRNGPVIIAGASVEAAVEPTAAPEPTTAPTEAAVAPTPAPARTETTQQPEKPWLLAVFVGLTLALGLAVGFFALKAMGEGARTTGVLALILAAVALAMGIAAIVVFNSDQYVKVTTIREEVLVEAGPAAQPVVYETVEDRLKAWQAKLPPEYVSLTSPFAVNDAEAVAAGRRIFRDNNCAVCHGSELKGDGDFSAALNPKPVNLTDPALMSLPFVTDTYLFWRVSEGGSQTPFLSAMPRWKMKLSDEERWQLVTFIRSQTAEAVAGEDQAAIAVIEKAGCFACHRLADRGGKIGPSWDGVGPAAATRVAGLSAEDYIRQSILDPGAFTAPGFEDKAEVMPRDFKDKLTPEEIDILVNFLAQQK